MSRMPAVSLLDYGFANVATCQYEYLCPGCNYIPPVGVCQLTSPYSIDFMEQSQPSCNTVSYLVDQYGRAYYQFQIPSAVVEQQRSIYHHCNFHESDFVTQVEEDEDARPRKRVRLADPQCYGSDPIVSTNIPGDSSNIYHAKEGYLVEEPTEEVPENHK